jgi:hypothetical protein
MSKRFGAQGRMGELVGCWSLSVLYRLVSCTATSLSFPACGFYNTRHARSPFPRRSGPGSKDKNEEEGNGDGNGGGARPGSSTMTFTVKPTVTVCDTLQESDCDVNCSPEKIISLQMILKWYYRNQCTACGNEASLPSPWSLRRGGRSPIVPITQLSVGRLAA